MLNISVSCGSKQNAMLQPPPKRAWLLGITSDVHFVASERRETSTLSSPVTIPSLS